MSLCAICSHKLRRERTSSTANIFLAIKAQRVDSYRRCDRDHEGSSDVSVGTSKGTLVSRSDQ